ncbi:MAG: L,D-transpeptidase/peptidoglycan binding protein [Solirubrobacterales bacterium]|nr:L,D-transpeptidase/peptidoglycan binding protein [Solirubrobacterales bacterium]
MIAAVFLLIGGAVGAYAYDSSTKDELAQGVTISGVNVSGMNRDQATEAVKNHVLAPRRKPVEVTFNKQTYKLPVKNLNIHADVGTSVDRAFTESREGSLPTRLVREVTGGEVNAAIPVEVTYSKKSVNKFVRDVAENVNEDPVDASVAAGPESLSVVKAKDGYRLRDNQLESQLYALLESGKGNRTLAAKVNVTKPEVTTKEVASKYPTYLTLDRGNYQLKLWKDLQLSKTYTVAVGQIGLETPAGTYNIQDKQVDPAWHVPNSAWAGDQAGDVVPGGVPENPLKARWMGIFAGAGIHGTDDTGSLGSAASHGCVRMAVGDVIDLYDRVDVGTPIYIG